MTHRAQAMTLSIGDRTPSTAPHDPSYLLLTSAPQAPDNVLAGAHYDVKRLDNDGVLKRKGAQVQAVLGHDVFKTGVAFLVGQSP